jgi:hypothetical protein
MGVEPGDKNDKFTYGNYFIFFSEYNGEGSKLIAKPTSLNPQV